MGSWRDQTNAMDQLIILATTFLDSRCSNLQNYKLVVDDEVKKISSTDVDWRSLLQLAISKPVRDHSPHKKRRLFRDKYRIILWWCWSSKDPNFSLSPFCGYRKNYLQSITIYTVIFYTVKILRRRAHLCRVSTSQIWPGYITEVQLRRFIFFYYRKLADAPINPPYCFLSYPGPDTLNTKAHI